MKPIQRKIERV